MHAEIEKRRRELVALCRRHGVERLEVFGSAARAGGFALSRSDADFLVTFAPAARNDLAAFADFKDALERLLGRPVDLVEREAVEASRNFIRRRRILAEAEAVYGRGRRRPGCFAAKHNSLDSVEEFLRELSEED